MFLNFAEQIIIHKNTLNIERKDIYFKGRIYFELLLKNPFPQV
jgi:hypothetical protein